MQYPWLDTNEYPFAPKYHNVNGYRMHYVDEGQGDIILFIHGTPSWSFDFRHCIKALSKTHRCIAIDHIGFGLSDKPEDYNYSTTQHSATLAGFIMEKKLKDINLVVHDFGGPIGLNVAIKYPDLVKRMVILNSWLWSSKEDPDFVKMRRILKNPLLPFLYRYLNFSPRFILPGSFGDKKISKNILKQYTYPFAGIRQRNGALAFAHSLINDQDWFEELWHQKEKINGKPAMFVWGMKDPVIRPHNLEKFNSGFPGAEVIRLSTCGHFPQEEEPLEVSNAIYKFIADGNVQR